jgi:aminoglycoside phosphotransferase (APT) family kinase protein
MSVDILLPDRETGYSQPYALTTHSPLTDELVLADLLARQPDRVAELTAAALAAIAPLHRQSATLIVVDDVCLLRRWVREPLAAVTEVCERIDPGLVAAADRVRKLLWEALIGRRMPTCWTHGQYTPDNVRLDVRGSVVGIDNWGRARPGQLALIDEYLMTLTASRQIEQAEFGALVAARLRGGLSERERDVLRNKHNRPTAYPEETEPLDEQAAILLTWLHVATAHLFEDTTYPQVDGWWATDVVPVLQSA